MDAGLVVLGTWFFTSASGCHATQTDPGIVPSRWGTVLTSGPLQPDVAAPAQTQSTAERDRAAIERSNAASSAVAPEPGSPSSSGSERLHPSLALLWRAGSSLSAEPAVAPDGTTYVVSRQGTLDVLEATGVHRFTITLGGTPAGKIYVDQRGWAYIGLITGKLVAITPQGQKYFTYDSMAGIASGLEYAENLGLLFLGRHRTIEAVNRAGFLTARIQYDHPLDSPPIGLDGWYVVATSQSELTWGDRFGRRIKRELQGSLRAYAACSDGGVWALTDVELVAFSKQRALIFGRTGVSAMSPAPASVFAARGIAGAVVTSDQQVEWLDAHGDNRAKVSFTTQSSGAELLQVGLDQEATAWLIANGGQLRLIQSSGEAGRPYDFEPDSLLLPVFDSPRRRTVLATRDGRVYQVNWPE